MRVPRPTPEAPPDRFDDILVLFYALKKVAVAGVVDQHCELARFDVESLLTSTADVGFDVCDTALSICEGRLEDW